MDRSECETSERTRWAQSSERRFQRALENRRLPPVAGSMLNTHAAKAKLTQVYTLGFQAHPQKGG